MLKLLIDEDVHGDITAGLRRRRPTFDIVRVQEVGLVQTPDSDILSWAAANGRVVVSADRRTMAAHAWDRVAQGLPMSGVAILRLQLSIGAAIDELEILAAAGVPDDLVNQVIYLPI